MSFVSSSPVLCCLPPLVLSLHTYAFFFCPRCAATAPGARLSRWTSWSSGVATVASATIPGSVSSSMCLYNLGGYDVRELFWIFSRGFCCILSQQWHMHYPLRESAYLCQGWQRFQLARPLGRLKSSSLEVGLIRAGVELRDGRVCLLQHLLHLRQVPCRSCIDTSRRIFQCGNFWNCPQPEASHLLSVQLC